jgi:hypothetical protein
MDRLPAPTDDRDRAEHDLREHGTCAVAEVLSDSTLEMAGATSTPLPARTGRAAGSRSSHSTTPTTTRTNWCGTS